MDWKQRALLELMSKISEDYYCAGWIHGNEYALWTMVADSTASRRYGQDVVTDEQVGDLRDIAAEIGGWFRWPDERAEASLAGDAWGPVFTPMAEWLSRYERHTAVSGQRAGPPEDA